MTGDTEPQFVVLFGDEETYVGDYIVDIRGSG